MVNKTENRPQPIQWAELPMNTRELLKGKLSGLWGAESDSSAFESWTVDKQQALLLLLARLDQKGLWSLVQKITNVYGEGGVGLQLSLQRMRRRPPLRKPAKLQRT